MRHRYAEVSAPPRVERVAVLATVNVPPKLTVLLKFITPKAAWKFVLLNCAIPFTVVLALLMVMVPLTPPEPVALAMVIEPVWPLTAATAAPAPEQPVKAGSPPGTTLLTRHRPPGVLSAIAFKAPEESVITTPLDVKLETPVPPLLIANGLLSVKLPNVGLAVWVRF